MIDAMERGSDDLVEHVQWATVHDLNVATTIDC